MIDVLLLHPERGNPGPDDTSIGGPLLWPDAEPWPMCGEPDEQDPSGETAVAMVPVAQVYRRDVPGSWWPGGADLLQVLWCPNVHWDAAPPQEEGAPVVLLRWRTAGELTARVATEHQLRVPVRCEEWLVPQPCTVRVEAAEDRADRPISRYDVWKVGGYPRWTVCDPYPITCIDCGAGTELLFTVSSGDETGVDIGRAGELRFFRCSEEAGHGVAFDVH
ncbi:hypothetical protein ABZ128_35450 [Streptomyces sp. NPDC006326]|uniref:hypothetical protein n=1 Tax=Streptomyces sp. NPDC006326 TaxID=3156752 RepID=UPI0033AE9DF7